MRQFKYKSSIIGKTPDNDNDDDNEIKEVEIVVSLKHLGGFWKNLNIPLVNCEINLIPTWSKNCVLTELIIQAADAAVHPRVEEIRAPTGAIFIMTDT